MRCFWHQGLVYSRHCENSILKDTGKRDDKRRWWKHFIVAQNGSEHGNEKKNLQRTSVLSLSGKFNPENIFSQSEHLANKEPKVTCEMGLKSTHLL